MKSAPKVALVAVFLMTGIPFALAHSGATGVVKQRMELMKDIGEATKTLAAMFKGERAYDIETVKVAATSIRDHAGARMTRLFPEGSLQKPTEAVPAIWQDWQEFEELAVRLADYSDALVKAADNPRKPAPSTGGTNHGRTGMAGEAPDAAALAGMSPDAAFVQVARTCRVCHGKFRAKKD